MRFIKYCTKLAIILVASSTLVVSMTIANNSEELANPIASLISAPFQLNYDQNSLGAGVRYWADSADSGLEGFGGRLVFTMLFPK